MKKLVMIVATAVMISSLSGCIIPPTGNDNYSEQGAGNRKHKHHHQDENNESGYSREDDASGYRNTNAVTRDGVTLPDCSSLPDASQADNGSRCWYN